MTLSTSAVAVCCCSASLSSRGARLHLLEQPHVLDRDHRLVGEGLDELDLPLRERSSEPCGDSAITPTTLPSRNSGTPSTERYRRAAEGRVRRCTPGPGATSGMWTVLPCERDPAGNRCPVGQAGSGVRAYAARRRDRCADWRHMLQSAVAHQAQHRHVGLAEIARRISTSVRAPVCRSNAERLMTSSTSAVAVCCCSASLEIAVAPAPPRRAAHSRSR